MCDDSLVSATLEEIIKSRTNALKRVAAGQASGQHSAVKIEKPRKRKRANEQKMNNIGTEKINQLARGNEIAGYGNFYSAETEKANVKQHIWLDSVRELTLLATRNMLIIKAKTEISKKLNEWRNAAAGPKVSIRDAGLEGKDNTKEIKSFLKYFPNAEANKVGSAGRMQDVLSSANQPLGKLMTFSPVSSSIDSETQADDSSEVSMAVPDPDFYDFDKDRAVNSFEDNQVWAAYDDDDGMPRYYAFVHNVISRKPFKMRISWLNSKNNAEFSQINWVGSGFCKTSGDFRVGKHETNKYVNSFSHRVKWTKGARGAVRIFQGKGDVWALYRNWSTEWNEHTPDEVIHQYDMVEVLDDYNKEKGITVIPLVKVAGLKTVFRKHMDQEKLRMIPREEMFRFSHQVPSCFLTGQESSTAPNGSLELDPAATSMELLQVISEAKQQVKKEISEKDTGFGLSDACKTYFEGLSGK